MGLGPSLDVTCYQFAGYSKAYFCRSTYTKFSEPVGTFQFRVGCFDPRTDFVPVFPFAGLLLRIHLIPQPNFGSDLQAEIPDGVTGMATAFAMIGSSHRTLIEHFAASANVSIENRMERTTRRVIATEDAVIDWAMAHRALGYKTLFVKQIDRGIVDLVVNQFLFSDLQGRGHRENSPAPIVALDG